MNQGQSKEKGKKEYEKLVMQKKETRKNCEKEHEHERRDREEDIQPYTQLGRNILTFRKSVEFNQNRR